MARLGGPTIRSTRSGPDRRTSDNGPALPRAALFGSPRVFAVRGRIRPIERCPRRASDNASAAKRHAAGPYDDIGEVSVGELIGNVTRDLSTLMRQELALAQAEVKAEVSKTGKAAGALGAAGFAGYMAVLFLSICLWWALGHLIGNGWSALVVAAIWGVIGAVLYASGRKKLREVNPTPERTVDTLKTVPDALKGEAGGHQ
jgi:hypothetical protein